MEIKDNVMTLKDSSETIQGVVIHKNMQEEGKRAILAKEHKLQVFVNEQPLYQIVCSPTDLKELILGRLTTEGIVSSMEDIASFFICETGERAKVFLQKKVEFQTVKEGEVIPTCCTDNKTYQTPVQTACRPLNFIQWDRADIFTMAEAMGAEMPLYEKTHAVHSAFLSYRGKILYACEDIGRHNALDKVIGHALCKDISLAECIVYTSGRVPTDMVMKVIRAGVPVLISKGAPTMDAITIAKQYGLTLYCNARKDSAVMYNDPSGCNKLHEQ